MTHHVNRFFTKGNVPGTLAVSALLIQSLFFVVLHAQIHIAGKVLCCIIVF
jgi:hypothetical protein